MVVMFVCKRKQWIFWPHLPAPPNWAWWYRRSIKEHSCIAPRKRICIQRTQGLKKKQYTWLLIITLTNVDRLSKFFQWQIPNETLCVTIARSPMHLNCVATLPCNIQKFKISTEHLLIPSKLISFTCNLTKINNIYMTNAMTISQWWFTSFLFSIWTHRTQIMQKCSECELTTNSVKFMQ